MAIYKDVEPLEVVTYQGENEDFDRGVNFILGKLDELPEADVVEVVRCKDCTEWDKDEGECSHWYGFRENDFCSYGERRDT